MATMPRRRTSTLIAGLSVAVMACGASTAVAADHDRTPTRHEVRHAQYLAKHQQRDVAEVRAELASAEARLHRAADAAGAAAEAYNGARYRLQLAQRAAAKAEREARSARWRVSRMRTGVVDSVTSSYEQSPSLAAMSALTSADGIDSVLESMTTMSNAEQALGQRYGDFQDARESAEKASSRAESTRQDAVQAADRAAAAREAAGRAAQAAQAEAVSISQRKSELVAELARLEGVSVRLATQRQAGLEERARRLAQEKAERQARAAAAAAAAQAAAAAAANQASSGSSDSSGSSEGSSGGSGGSAPSNPAPPSGGGVSAALAFARAQIGEPYVWGAAGPGSWDCSGLTMAAWRQGGKYLPHYSVAQYEQSTPITLSQLQPGDLVFWATTSSPSSIHHVALYAGNGMIIQAPRTGRDVDEESMYAWEPPSFFARP